MLFLILFTICSLNFTTLLTLLQFSRLQPLWECLTPLEEHTLLSTIAEPGTPSDIDISSSIGSLPSPLLFHIDLQDEDKKKSLPIAIPVLLPINNLFEQNNKQIACKTILFTKLPHLIEEIWAECAV
jgi:hypothetical protein